MANIGYGVLIAVIYYAIWKALDVHPTAEGLAFAVGFAAAVGRHTGRSAA